MRSALAPLGLSALVNFGTSLVVLVVLLVCFEVLSALCLHIVPVPGYPKEQVPHFDVCNWFQSRLLCQSCSSASHGTEAEI